MMLIRSFVGIFVYMFEMSNDANFSSGANGICEISFISWVEFWMLYTLGIGIFVFKMSVSILASLYDGAFLKFTTGRMGVPSLWIFINPLNGGVSGFRLMSLPLLSMSIRDLQLFIVLLRSFRNFVVMLLFTISPPLFAMNSRTFCS